MTMITTLRARVSPHAISKVTRIFNGILAGIRMAFADRVAWRIPHGRTLRLSWSSAASYLTLDPAQEGPAQ